MNDMQDTLQSMCKILGDDSKIYNEIASTHDQEVLQNDLDRLSEWSKTWLLQFSIQHINIFNLDI